MTPGIASVRLLEEFGSPTTHFAFRHRASSAATCQPRLENKKLYEKVLERGAINRKFSLGTHPAPENFPVRNHIGRNAGWVVVVEGAQRSGSLITARLAIRFGREVFAVGA